MADTPQEGFNPFAGTDEETSADSPAENNNADDTQNQGGDDNADSDNQNDEEGSGAGADDDQDDDQDKNVPFHQHPAWKRREDEWQSRFNDQEKRHQDDIKALREEFGGARKDDVESSEIPSWFGGNQKQWDEFRAFNKQQIEAAKAEAIKSITEKSSAEQRAVQEATDFLKSELTFLESDKTINPEGKKIDPNKLVKITVDNDLIDSKGRWNYRAGYKLMQGMSSSAPAPKTGDRKKIASATTEGSHKGEIDKKGFKTGEDFKNNRPW